MAKAEAACRPLRALLSLGSLKGSEGLWLFWIYRLRRWWGGVGIGRCRASADDCNPARDPHPRRLRARFARCSGDPPHKGEGKEAKHCQPSATIVVLEI